MQDCESVKLWQQTAAVQPQLSLCKNCKTKCFFFTLQMHKSADNSFEHPINRGIDRTRERPAPPSEALDINLHLERN